MWSHIALIGCRDSIIIILSVSYVSMVRLFIIVYLRRKEMQTMFVIR